MGLKTISYLYLPVPGTQYFLAIHGQLSKIICWFFIEMLFFFPIISLFSIIFMIFSLSPIAYFPFLSWDCCHVEQAAAAAVGSSQGWWRHRHQFQKQRVLWVWAHHMVGAVNMFQLCIMFQAVFLGRWRQIQGCLKWLEPENSINFPEMFIMIFPS